MNMMQEICNKVDYLAEAICLLRNIATGESYMELKTSLCAKRNITFESKEKTLEILYKIEKAAIKAFSAEKETMDYYFTVEEKAQRSCGDVLFLWDGFGSRPYVSLEEHLKYLDAFSIEEYTKEFGKHLQSYTDNLGDESTFAELKEPMEIISYLMTMDISQNEKWKLQTIFMNQKEHFPKVIALVKKMIDFLHEFEPDLTELVQDFYDYWSGVLSNQTLREYMKKRIEMPLPDNPYGYRLRPGILAPTTMGIHVSLEDDGTYTTQDEGWVGILFGDELSIFSGGEKEEETNVAHILQVLKLLSDKSKFEILSRISKESAYGSQLAKEMNLTAATISHHVNSLIAAGIVTIEMRDKRVYYRLEKENLEKVLVACKDIFVH